jgi:predicted alpha-1,2-mannosidase
VSNYNTMLLDYVNPRQGSRSDRRFSEGNCLPLVSLPFGMTNWAPQSRESEWFFHGADRQLQGIRATHQPSPWMGEYGAFVLMPQTGPLVTNGDGRFSAYRADQMTLRPDYLSVDLIRYRTRLELTPTARCAVLRLTFSEATSKRLLVMPVTGETFYDIAPDGRTVSGYTRGNSGGVTPDFACHFVLVFDRAVTGTGEGKALALDFSAEAGEQVEVKVATSFIGPEQALRNLEQEVGEKDFDGVRAEAARVWEKTLGCIEIEGATEEQNRTFYTCLYRAALFPREFHEYDAAGAPIHYSPYIGGVHPGVLYTDNGFWDTYRTVYPLLSLLWPARLSEILEGWTQAYRESGWFPRWPSPGHRDCMIGTHSDVLIADAVAKGITGFDLETAYKGLHRNAFDADAGAGAYGRRGLAYYHNLGYVPADRVHEATACTLDYAYNDWCVAQVAQALGHKDDYQILSERANNYKNLFDPAVGFMRGKNEDGSWEEPWSEFRWGSPHVEGGPWQGSWAVQHDVEGLIALHGGPEPFCAKLDTMLATPPYFEVGQYGFEIHEMTEMAVANFGQYAHSNQPVHHVLYLFAYAGQPEKTQYWVRRILSEYYSPDFLPGDEDNGEMAAWYVLSSLGFYPVCPGKAEYVLGSPLFPKATVHLENGHDLCLEAPENGPQNVYVQAVTVNDQPHTDCLISHATLAEGARVRFQMGQAA